MNGWILLHKKIWESENFRPFKNRSKLILVWIWLLTHCDKDGVVTCGRHQIAEETGLSSSSVKRVLEVFAKCSLSDQLVTSQPTNKFTRFTILKWHEYQRKVTNEMNPKCPASAPQVTTNKEERIKNKDIYIGNTNNKNKTEFLLKRESLLNEKSW